MSVIKNTAFWLSQVCHHRYQGLLRACQALSQTILLTQSTLCLNSKGNMQHGMSVTGICLQPLQ